MKSFRPALVLLCLALAAAPAAAAAGLMTTPAAQGPSAKAMSEMQAAIAENGIPLEQDMQITMSGTGQMAQMMTQTGAGNMRSTMTVTELSVDTIPAEMFAIPGAAATK